jgi:hypothetical protein
MRNGDPTAEIILSIVETLGEATQHIREAVRDVDALVEAAEEKPGPGPAAAGRGDGRQDGKATARRVAAVVAVLLAIAPLAACNTKDERLGPAAVKALCQASEDAVRADRRAERDFDAAAAASERGGWDQSLALVEARFTWRVADQERWRRLSAELLDAFHKKTDTHLVVLRTTRDISVMYTRALRLGDEGSISALDACRADMDRYSNELAVGVARVRTP